MSSLKRLKTLEAQPTLFAPEEMPILEAVNDEEGIEPEPEPATDWYVPKKSWSQIFAERSGGTVASGWNDEVNELRQFFNRPLPKEIRLNAWSMVNNVTEFVSAHLATVQKYNGNKNFLPYMARLKQLKSIL